MRKDFARSQSQSTEDPDLAKAEPRFHFDHKSWALPPGGRSTLKASIHWIATWSVFLRPEPPGSQFYADNLNNGGDAATRLGLLSQLSLGQRWPGAFEHQRSRSEVWWVCLAKTLSKALTTKHHGMQIDNVF